MSATLLEETLKTIIAKSNQLENRKDAEGLTITEFVKGIKDISGIDLEYHYIDIIDAFLHNKFSISISESRNSRGKSIIIEGNPKILQEPNLLVRFIENLSEIILITDEIFPKQGCMKGLSLLFEAFKTRKLFQFLKMADIDLLETTGLITIIHHYLKGKTVIRLDDVCTYMPKSYLLRFEDRITNETMGIVIQKLIKIQKEYYVPDIHFSIQPRLISLLCNKTVELL
jgi:hypothetical protein